MDARSRAVASGRIYEDFDPQTNWVMEDTVNTFIVHLPDFKKEHLRVQLTPYQVLKISGERPLGDNKWKRFLKEIRVAADCNTEKIKARFEGGILYITQPKTIQPPAPKEEVTKPSSVAKASQQPPKLPSGELAKPATQTTEAEDASKGKEAGEEPSKRELGEGNEPSKGKHMTDEAGQKEDEKQTKDEKVKKRDEGREEKSEIVSGVGRDIFMALKRPENIKKVVGTVLVALALAIHIAYVKRICRRGEDHEL